MNIGEPSGRNDIQAESPDSVLRSKPSRIVVRINFKEAETGIVDRGLKGMLDRPLRDMLDAATVRTTQAAEGERPTRKPIGVFQGLTSKRVDGLMRYEASVSATPSYAEEVKENVLRGIEGMQRTLKNRLENVVVDLVGTENAADTPSDASVELNHETPDRDVERREDNGGSVGVEITRA